MKPEYVQNRANFPAEELAKYRGLWVAFSLDGKHIVASAPDLEQMEQCLAACGKDPESVAYEYVGGPEDDVYLGGAELS
jgi:hypothetical protein